MTKPLGIIVLLGLVMLGAEGKAQRKEYLTEEEQDLIRETGLQPVTRVNLFLKFAADRLQKFQAAAASANTKDRSSALNDLLAAYTSCVDDTTDTLELNLGRRVDLRKAIALAREQLSAFLSQLEEFQKKEGPDLQLVRETLEDSIIATREAIAMVEKAAKEQPPSEKHKKGER